MDSEDQEALNISFPFIVDGSNELGENIAADDGSMESMATEVPEFASQKPDAGLSECIARNATSVDAIQQKEGLAEVNRSVEDNDMQKEEEEVGEDPNQTKDLVVRSNEGDDANGTDSHIGADGSIETQQKEEELLDAMASPIHVRSELEPEGGLNEGQCLADNAPTDIMQGEAPTQIEQSPKVGTNEEEPSADEAFMEVTALQEDGSGEGDTSKQGPYVGSHDGEENGSGKGETFEHEPQVGSSDGENSVDEAFIITAYPKDDSGKGVTFQQEPHVGSNDGMCSANEAFMATPDEEDGLRTSEQDVASFDKDSVEGDAPVETRATPFVEVSAAANNEDDDDVDDEVVDAEPLAEGEGGGCTSEEEPLESLTNAASFSVVESQGNLPENNGMLAVLEDARSDQVSHAREAIEAEANVQADYSELPTIQELNEKAEDQPPSATDVKEPLIKEPSLCTPATESSIDQEPDGYETLKGKAGNDGQSGFTNPEDDKHGMEGEIRTELPVVSKQDMEIKQPIAEEEPIIEAHLGEELFVKSEGPPMDDALARFEIADAKQLEVVPLLKTRNWHESGHEAIVNEQAKGVATRMLIEEDANADNSDVSKGATDMLQRDVDTHDGMVEFKAANKLSPSDLENVDYQDCHNLEEAKLVFANVKTLDGGSDADAIKLKSAQNGLLKEGATADSGKHVDLEQSNGSGKARTLLEEETNASEPGEMAASAADAQIIEASIDAAVPLSSMVPENGFFHDSEDNIMGQCHTKNAPHFQDEASTANMQEEKSREMGWSPAALQQTGGKGSNGAKQKDVECIKGNATLERQTSWWGCCGMLDVLLKKAK